ncbi:MAG TPA: hypothetical protein PLD05_13690 [Thermogutta sp.]|nr:hypothetical protein [Thermogutta sp.]
MAQERISDQELEAYLDEALPPERMVAIENALRHNHECLLRLRRIVSRRDNGIHSVAEIWRRNRLSCPSREALGAYLLGALTEPESTYVKIHLETVGCAICLANLEDLRAQGVPSDGERAEIQRRRQKYFQSSIGHLSRRE